MKSTWMPTPWDLTHAPKQGEEVFHRVGGCLFLLVDACSCFQVPQRRLCSQPSCIPFHSLFFWLFLLLLPRLDPFRQMPNLTRTKRVGEETIIIKYEKWEADRRVMSDLTGLRPLNPTQPVRKTPKQWSLNTLTRPSKCLRVGQWHVPRQVRGNVGVVNYTIALKYS